VNKIKEKKSMVYNRGDKVSYKGKSAKVIGVKVDNCGKTRYNLRLKNKFNTIAYNINSKELSKIEIDNLE
jgi:hypothetical protein